MQLIGRQEYQHVNFFIRFRYCLLENVSFPLPLSQITNESLDGLRLLLYYVFFVMILAMEHAAEKAKLFRQIFQSMLKLGCDSDIVVRQLFNPMCLQTIHWFSKPNSPFGTDLMEVLTVSQPYD